MTDAVPKGVRDGVGVLHFEELPKLNVKKLIQCWDWVDYKSGLGGEPAWNQMEWVTEVNTEEALEEGLRFDEENFCGSAFCVAGYALRDQLTDTKNLPGIVINAEGDEYKLVPSAANNIAPFQGNDTWERAGAHVLGLTWSEASQLFSPENEKEKIRDIMNATLKSRGEEIVL